MVYLVLVRHGRSQWNLENRFTGWTDVPLTEAGRREAECAGDVLNHTGIPIVKDTALNERDYGDLTGMNKDAG